MPSTLMKIEKIIFARTNSTLVFDEQTSHDKDKLFEFSFVKTIYDRHQHLKSKNQRVQSPNVAKQNTGRSLRILKIYLKILIFVSVKRT